MHIKLNSVVLQDNIIDRMKILLNQTKNDRLEHGFDVCRKNNNLIIRNECRGTICSLDLPQKCDINEKLVGDYHTHPRGIAKMSDTDMYDACQLDFSCIGSVLQNRIACYIRYPNINIDKCKEDSNRDAPSDKYFRQTDIKIGNYTR